MKITAQPANTQQKHNTIKVRIDELVLHGFPPSDRHGITSAIETELARLMTQASPTWPRNPPAVEGINAAATQVKAGAKPKTVGTDIGRAVFKSLQRHSRTVSNLKQKGGRDA